MAPQKTDEREQGLAKTRFRQVEQLFQATCRMTPVEREDYLQREGVSEELRREVATLWECDEIHGDAFDEAWLESSRAAKAGVDSNPSTVASIAPGAVLGDFRIESVIGRGGMAVVYRARQNSLNRTVALKVLSYPLMSDSVRQRFQREAAAGAQLHHENIVTVHQFGQQDDLPYFAMELIEGPTLAEWLAQQRSQDTRRSHPATDRYVQVSRWAAEVADGLAHAHANGVIHRDIKPSNLILTPEGQAKILDFGVAKLRRASMLTTTGAVLGTPRYMSPEQFSSATQKVDHRTDIYSLGATLYELLTLHPPFEGDDFGQVMHAICNSEPLPPQQLDPHIPADLDAICLQAMAREPRERYQQADQLASDLGNYLAGRPISIKPRGQLTRLGRAVCRRRQRVVVAAAIILAAIAAASLAWRPSGPPRLTLASQRQVTSDRGFTSDPSLSSDGRWLVYASDRLGKGDTDIWMQELNRDGSKKGDPFTITSDPGDETEPAVSPDGHLIAYCASGKVRGIYTRAVDDNHNVSEARLLCERGRGPRFSPDGEWIAYWVGWSSGRMLTERGEAIWVAPTAGGAPRQLCPEFVDVAYPVWSPDGKKILFCGATAAGPTKRTDAHWWVTPIEGGTAAPIDIVASLRDQGIEWPSICIPFCWTPRTNFVILSGMLHERFRLWALPLAPDTLRIGTLQQLTSGGSQEFYANVASNGRICFATAEYDYGLWSAPIDANRAVVTGPLARVADNPAIESNASVTADGSLMVFHSDRGGDVDIYAMHGKSQVTRLIGGKGHQGYPVISADGAKIAYLDSSLQDSETDGWLLSLAELTNGKLAGVRQRALGENRDIPLDWHPSSPSRYLLTGSNGALRLVDTETGVNRPILPRPQWWIGSARFSPNGQWIAFSANGTIFVAPFELEAEVSASWIPITDGASRDNVPNWSPDGNTLYFLSDRDGRPCVWSQALEPTTRRPAGAPTEVYHFREFRRSPVAVGSHLRPFTVSQDRLIFCLGNHSGNVFVAELETE